MEYVHVFNFAIVTIITDFMLKESFKNANIFRNTFMNEIVVFLK